VTGEINKQNVVVGTSALLREQGITLPNAVSHLRTPTNSALLVAIGTHLAGVIVVADAVKQDAAATVQDLRRAGVNVVMLTGDNPATAQGVAQKVGIEEFEAGVLPGRKAEVVARLQKGGHIVAMAGDGINDAPALAQANVGIAMGTGTDVAMSAGNVILVKGDLQGILRARKLSQAAMRNIRQNLFSLSSTTCWECQSRPGYSIRSSAGA